MLSRNKFSVHIFCVPVMYSNQSNAIKRMGANFSASKHCNQPKDEKQVTFHKH